MKVSYEWLKELVNIDVSAEEIAKKFLLSGLEVEGIIKTGIGNQNVVTGEILKLEKHPKSETLFVLEIDCGGLGKKIIITNLTGLKVGQKLLVALDGVKFVSGFEVKKSKVKDIDSDGMLVRWEDLGFPLKGDYAIFVGNDIKNGVNYNDIGAFTDYIIDIELTANRGDCLGMSGVAREVKTLFKTTLKPMDITYKTNEKSIHDIAKVEIQSKNCLRYTGGVILGVEIKPSPLWMQLRIVKAGIRPISNVVDLTNYIMLECNQPLHSFDMDKIADKKVIIRDAKAGEKITTLDNIERKLETNDILITDKNQGHCIGGIMGGVISEVTDTTKNIFLEAAFFRSTNIRKTSKRLGLKSESSYRFERNIDRDNVLFSLKRALRIFNKLNLGNICDDVIDDYPEKYQKPVIVVSVEWINNKLGTDLKESEMINILTSLEFEVTKEKENMKIIAPSFRTDVSIKEDIAEEIARVYGFNNIIPTIYPSKNAATLTPLQDLEKNLRELCYKLGLDEAFNLSLVGDSLFDKMKLTENHKYRNIVRMDVPLSDDLQGMRSALIPGLVRTTAFNFSRANKGISMFEIGNVSYPSNKELPDYEKMCGIVLAGVKYFKDYTNPELKYDYYDIKGVADAVFDNFKPNVTYISSEESFLHPYQQAKILFNGKEAGIIGKLHPLIAESMDITGDTFLIEFSVNKLFENSNAKLVYKEVPKFPSSVRDMALIVNENIESYKILETVKNANINYLQSVKIFDVYKGENIESGKYSLAISMEFNKIHSTLTDDEVNSGFDKILNILKEKFDAKIR